LFPGITKNCYERFLDDVVGLHASDFRFGDSFFTKADADWYVATVSWLEHLGDMAS
jgi:hypothetical protein